MTDFRVHDRTTAPKEAGQLFDSLEQKMGFVPNLAGIMAEAPPLLEGYLTLNGLFNEKTSLSDTERHIVLLAVSHDNGCHYCMAAHSTSARMKGVDDSVVAALREGAALDDPKLDAFARLVREVVAKRGYPSNDAIQAFLDAGYEKRQLLEVILGVGLKTLSNYTNHIAETPLDEVFSAQAWDS